MARAGNQKKKGARKSPSPRAALDRRPLWLALAAVAAAALVYANTLHNPFVYDDLFVVVGNPSIRQLGDPLGLVLRDVFRPVVNFSYAVDYTIWGLRPFGFHLTSLAMHLVNVVLLFVVVRRLGDDRGGAPDKDGEEGPRPIVVAAVAAFLFAVHPLLSEAVGYTSARSELLCTGFLLAAFLALRSYLLRGGWRPLIGGLLLFVLALLSKETAAMLPFMLLAWDVLLLPGEGRRRRTLTFHLPVVAVIVAAGLARVAVYLRVEQAGTVQGLWHNLLAAVVVLWRYVALLVAPLRLSVVHAVRSFESLGDVTVLLSMVALVALVVAGFRLRRTAPLVVLGGAWFLLLLAPSHLIPLQEAMAEHRAYTASCGAFLVAGAVAAWLDGWWRRRNPEQRRRWLLAPALVVLVALAVLTVLRNRVWADPVSLWGDAAAKAPDTWAAQYALADALREAGRCAEAVPVYERAIALQPAMVDAHLNAAICLGEMGRLDAALGLLNDARDAAPSNPKVYNNLGVVAARQGNAEAARSYFLEALARDPGNIQARRSLAQLAEMVFNDPARALELCREIVSLAPGTSGAAECVERNRRRLSGG